MRAAVLVAPGRVEVRDRPEPSLGSDDALVAPRAVAKAVVEPIRP
ncbi:MAG TPA: hypothetical protein VGM69_12390 [Chloroflexota bacterium]|jgi:hypothetical protein